MSSGEHQVTVFFYGSYMNRDVLAEVDIEPETMEVATLHDYDIHIGPLANVVRAAGSTVWGVVTQATHDQLARLYRHAREVLGGSYHPEAVLVRDAAGNARPALCYISHDLEPATASADYVDRVVEPGREYGFPEPYLAKLESFRTG